MALLAFAPSAGHLVSSRTATYTGECPGEEVASPRWTRLQFGINLAVCDRSLSSSNNGSCNHRLQVGAPLCVMIATKLACKHNGGQVACWSRAANKRHYLREARCRWAAIALRRVQPERREKSFLVYHCGNIWQISVASQLVSQSVSQSVG